MGLRERIGQLEQDRDILETSPYVFPDLGLAEGECPSAEDLEAITEAMHRKGARCRVVPWDGTLDKTLAGLDRYIAERDRG